MSIVPIGTNFTGEFYGETTCYKRVAFDHLNQVSEEWQVLHNWYYWNKDKWEPVGVGFSARRCEPYYGNGI